MTDYERQQRARTELARQQQAIHVLQAHGWRVTGPKTDAARTAQAELVLQARGYRVTPPRHWR